MQLNILWKGLYYQSLENCSVMQSEAGNEVGSTIVGRLGQTVYTVDYLIRTDTCFRISSARIRTQLNGRLETISLEMRADRCYINGQERVELRNHSFIDISLTPYTNTLPINNLKLKTGERRIIDVIYFDILEETIQSVKQIYTRLAAYEYMYENGDGSFRAKITVDQHGIVSIYPELFELVFKHDIG